MFVKAKKHLGQHFLTDEGIAKDIADALTGIGYDDVLEIGPGMGVLTKYLLQQKAKITVMELDRESVAYLHDTFPLSLPLQFVNPYGLSIFGSAAPSSCSILRPPSRSRTFSCVPVRPRLGGSGRFLNSCVAPPFCNTTPLMCSLHELYVICDSGLRLRSRPFH